MKVSQKMIMLAATGGYAGYAPVVPGTFGTVVGLLPAFLLSLVGSCSISSVLLVLFVLLSIRISDRAEQILGTVDPGCIVIDEIAGIMVTLWCLPFNWPTVLAGFVFFRCLDMIKPFPIRYVERRLSGGLGIVADDVVAGVAAHIVLRIVF